MTCLTFCQVKVNTARFLPQSDSGVISEVNLLCHACSNRKGLEGKNVHMNDFYILPYARNNSSRTRVPSIQFQKTTPAVLCNTVLVFFKEKSAVSYSLRTPGSRSSSMPPLSHSCLFKVLPGGVLFCEGDQACIPHPESYLELTEMPCKATRHRSAAPAIEGNDNQAG